MKRMKRLITPICLILLAACVLAPMQGAACTSFAVYGEEPLYGNNFDFTDTHCALSFYLTAEQGYVFQVYFNAYGGMGVNSLMNHEGLFGAIMYQSPREIVFNSGRDTTEFVKEMPRAYASLADVQEILADEQLSNRLDSFHLFFADAQGHAMVVDFVEGGQVITTNTRPYLVAASFPNVWLDEKEVAEIHEGGIERYIAADAYIGKNLEGFDLEDAFTVLESTLMHRAQDDPDGARTQYSLVYAPHQEAIYLAIRGDFSKIWKVSMADQTVETYRGFAEHTSYTIGDGQLAFDALLQE